MKTIINKVCDYIFPVKCACCGHGGEGVVCGECEDGLYSAGELSVEKLKKGKTGMLNRTGADEVYFAYKYGDKKLTKLLFALKQKNNRALAEYFALKILETLTGGIQCGIITNAPRSGENKALYGYDHAEAVARQLAEMTNIQYIRCLAKKDTGADQKTLTFEERKKNSEGKYTVTSKEIPRSVLIVDDVCTSGETLGECINMLRQSGAETVIAAVIANRM